ncbi:hypothetical protein ACA910_012807 [Epithemia clementina (nom. ined.)]
MDATDDLDRILNGEGRDLSARLGIRDHSGTPSATPLSSQVGVEEELTGTEYDICPDPQAEKVDLSKIRGQIANAENKFAIEDDPETELAALAELLPEVTKRRPAPGTDVDVGLPGMERGANDSYDKNRTHEEVEPPTPAAPPRKPVTGLLDASGADDDVDSSTAKKLSVQSVTELLNRQVRMKVVGSGDQDASRGEMERGHTYDSNDINGPHDATSFEDYPDSDNALNDANQASEEEATNIPKEFLNSGQSISTATQTHEVRMPMYLPTFKPATGCTNASDFIVRCFVARLRSGITVVKHGRSRWCKSRLRVLQIHPDGRSLTWKPAEGEPTTNRKPPKLDLSTCLEVRHAWSPDPHNPMYTGTPILRQKCEAANAHKSFALIFKHRTVDITAVTADQCKVLMEGFSALCFRLQVASLAGRSGNRNKAARPMPDEDGVSVTASATLTNSSTPKNR